MEDPIMRPRYPRYVSLAYFCWACFFLFMTHVCLLLSVSGRGSQTVSRMRFGCPSSPTARPLPPLKFVLFLGGLSHPRNSRRSCHLRHPSQAGS
jgi:hypothetical protein